MAESAAKVLSQQKGPTATEILAKDSMLSGKKRLAFTNYAEGGGRKTYADWLKAGEPEVDK